MFPRWLEMPNFNTILLGPRRAGKTTLLKQKYQKYKYVTLDDLDTLDWAERDPKGLITSLGKEFIVDEVQRYPKLTIAIKYAIDEQNAKAIMTGSSAIGLLDDTADSLAGRIDILHLPTLCWGEEIGEATHSFFSDKLNLPQIKNANRQLETALEYGGFPELASQENEEKRAILYRYRDTYFARDLIQLANIENLTALLALYHHLLRSIGSILEVSKFSNESGLSFKSTKKYINVLQQSDLVFSLAGYQYGPAKRFIKAPKIYFSDNGIITSFGTKLSQGQIIENFVISELEKRRKLGQFGRAEMYFYRSNSGAEIDLIIDCEDVVLAIEIKSSKKVSSKELRHLKAFETKVNKPTKKYIVNLGDEYLDIEGINVIPIAALFRSKAIAI